MTKKRERHAILFKQTEHNTSTWDSYHKIAQVDNFDTFITKS